jgi:S-formylglutathione hydrolase FrmB
MTMQTVSLNKSHNGVQGVYKHPSRETRTDMTFSVYVPPHAGGARLPVVWYLSGLTCTHANVTEKGEFRSACAAQHDHATPLSIANRISSADVRTPSLWRMIDEVLATVL